MVVLTLIPTHFTAAKFNRNLQIYTHCILLFIYNCAQHALGHGAPGTHRPLSSGGALCGTHHPPQRRRGRRSGVHVSRFGVIPKPHQPGKWRLITDLSSPKGSSVNDGVAPALCSVSYASVDDAVRCIASLGRGALLAKFDIASAYWAVPVHPEDRRLLGMKWRGNVFVDEGGGSINCQHTRLGVL